MRMTTWGALSLACALACVVSGCSSCHGKDPGASDAAVDGKGVHTETGPVTTRAVVEAGPADNALPPQISDELTTRAKHLLEAIRRDDGDLAADMIFPRDAYLNVKDVPDPGKHWDAKVLAAFRKHVHLLHKHTKGVERATFTTFDVGQSVVQAPPKKRDLKRSLWRARHSRLGFTIDGKPGHFDLLEMTAWQGSWYITRLK